MYIFLSVLLLSITFIISIYLVTTKGIHMHSHEHHHHNFPEVDEEKEKEKVEEQTHSMFNALSETVKDVLK